MKITFFEVQDWEKEALSRAFPEATLLADKLNNNTDITDKLQGVEIISTFINSEVNGTVMQKIPSLKFIVTRSTGFDHIDVPFARSKSIIVSNVPEYGSNTVAEHTFALILSLSRKIYQSVSQSKNLNFDHSLIRGVDLNGKTIGILGLGKIGINVLKIASGFGMKALVYNRSTNESLAKKYDFNYATLEEVLKNSDFITLHLPLTVETKYIINETNILLLKRGSFLVNTARGGLVKTEAIIMALNEGVLAGAALDVLEEEKELSEEGAILTSEFRDSVDLKNLVYNHILINHPKVLITPHNAFNSEEALDRITKTTINNINSFMKGNPINLID